MSHRDRNTQRFGYSGLQTCVRNCHLEVDRAGLLQAEFVGRGHGKVFAVVQVSHFLGLGNKQVRSALPEQFVVIVVSDDDVVPVATMNLIPIRERVDHALERGTCLEIELGFSILAHRAVEQCGTGCRRL